MIHPEPVPMIPRVGHSLEDMLAEAHAALDAPAGGIGDVNSEARGSGARFNAGKLPVELVPVWIVADYYVGGAPDDAPAASATDEAIAVLHTLGRWQTGELCAADVLREMDDWVEDCTRVFDYGRKKYAAWNWAKGMSWSVPMACAVRHCLAILRGEKNDPESGLPHRGHLACNLVMLAQYELTYREGDDRPRHLWPDQKAA